VSPGHLGAIVEISLRCFAVSTAQPRGRVPLLAGRRTHGLGLSQRFFYDSELAGLGYVELVREGRAFREAVYAKL
jgi:hypothetical protein